jgi:hypothetical protein
MANQTQAEKDAAAAQKAAEQAATVDAEQTQATTDAFTQAAQQDAAHLLRVASDLEALRTVEVEQQKPRDVPWITRGSDGRVIT